MLEIHPSLVLLDALSWRQRAIFYGILALVFLATNPALLLPDTINYLIAYATEQTLTHHGYFMMGHLYPNNVSDTPGGTPIYFYVLYLLVKTPLPILAAMLAGLIIIFKKRREPGPFFLSLMFLMWIVPYSIVGAKWLRYTLSLMPIIYIIGAIGIVKLFDLLAGLVKERTNPVFRRALVAAFVLLFFLAPLWSAARSAPFYSLYLNPLGFGRIAYFFPHDEIYDVGLRETIKQICREAVPEASVGGESSSVFRYYFDKFGRNDLRYFNLSDPAERTAALSSAYVVVQDGRKYFENISLIEAIESRYRPAVVTMIRDAVVARVYRVENLAQLRQPK